MAEPLTRVVFLRGSQLLSIQTINILVMTQSKVYVRDIKDL